MNIKVMADYDCWPLWHYQDDVGNIDPAALDLSPGLIEALLAWAEEYDSILNRQDPASTSWPSIERQKDFVDRGRQLALKLKVELASAGRVGYFNDMTGKIEEV